MTSQTVTYETSSPPSTKHHRDSPDKVRSDGHRAVRAGWMNQGLSAPPKKGTVKACDHHRRRLAGGCRYPPATTRRAVGDGGRADLPGCVRDVSTTYLTNQPANRCRHGSGGAVRRAATACWPTTIPATPAATALRRRAQPICHAAPATAPLSLLSGAGRRDPWRRRWAGWEDKETPPSRWLAARAKT